MSRPDSALTPARPLSGRRVRAGQPNGDTMTETARDIEIYPVGVLSDLQRFIHEPDRARARRILRQTVRRAIDHIRDRNWRALRNSFNGYLAEHATRGTRCGHGWTKGRAYRDLIRHLDSLPAAPVVGEQPHA